MKDKNKQPSPSSHGFSQESGLHLKRKHCNLYSSATGDWLTFTSPVEQRKREWREGGENNGGRQGVGYAGFDRSTTQDGCA